MADSFMRTDPCYEEVLFPGDQCLSARSIRRPSHHARNAAFLFIDYQPSQLATVRSMDPGLLLKNAVSTVRTIKTFGVPVVHSTVNVANGQGPTLPELAVLMAPCGPTCA